MCQNRYLTNRTSKVKIVFYFTLCLSILTAACKNGTVTDVAQANPPQAAATPALVQGTAAAASPATNSSPLTPGATPTPATSAAPEVSAPAGASPSPAASMRHIDSRNIVITDGKSDPSLMEPPPTPTPTPAPTPTVEMVNGKIKQVWQAPAEVAALKSPLKVTADIVKRGQYLYKNRCESCHGSEGKGNGPYNSPKWKQATNLASQVVQANTDGELFYKASTSRGRHPASKVLYTDEERWMIVAFLRTLK
jgi:mono/diheme cytochrome c family protein